MYRTSRNLKTLKHNKSCFLESYFKLKHYGLLFKARFFVLLELGSLNLIFKLLLSANPAVSNSLASCILNVSTSCLKNILTSLHEIHLQSSPSVPFFKVFLFHIKDWFHKHAFILLLLLLFWSAYWLLSLLWLAS